jgi:5-methylcytosine-specific restriction endonuclease McrA
VPHKDPVEFERYHRRYRERNRERLRLNAIRYRKERRTEINERRRLRRLEKPGENYSHVKKWRERNPDKQRKQARVFVSIRRARKKSNGPFERVDPDAVLRRDRGVCGICGKPVEGPVFEIDHIVPLSRGGAHTMANVQLAHRTCNRKKWNRTQLESAPP